MVRPSTGREGRHVGRVLGNLPVEIGSFIGRRAELAEVGALARTSRVLSLVGPGGVGKTRLALEVGAEQRRPHGVWLVDVALASEASQVAQQVGESLGIRKASSESWHQALANALRDRDLLLILDTCERHTGACADLARVLIRECPLVHMLATSREPLGIPEEVVFRVPPLSLPEAETDNLRQLLASEAMELFVARAAAAQNGFTLTADNAADLVRLCRELDGLPLGLELVAGHMPTLGLRELAARVHVRLALSLSGRRDAPSRHQTLRATLDWSYALLSDDEQRLLRRLAVFVGGWTFEGALTVCGDSSLPMQSLNYLLGRLRQKSLVFDDRNPAGRRERLLDVTRQYALEKLVESDEWEQVASRHLEWCVSVAQHAASGGIDLRQADWLEREQDNLRAALGWAVAHGELEQGLRIVIAVFPWWAFQGQVAEARTWIDRLLELPVGSTALPLRDLARACRAEVLILHAEYAAAEVELATLLEEQRRRADAAGIGHATMIAGNAALWQGQLERARTLFDESLERLSQTGRPWARIALLQAARVAYLLQDFTSARALITRALQPGELRAQSILIDRALQLQARLAADAGEVASALVQLSDAANRQRQAGDQTGRIDTLVSHGQVLLGVGRAAGALASFTEAAHVAWSADDQVRLTCTIEGIAQALAGTDPEVATRLAAACTEKRARLGAKRWPADQASVDAAMRLARASLGDEAYTRAWQFGASMLDADVFALAVASTESRPGPAPLGVSTLTQREREVLLMLGRGASAVQIGEQLVISPATVRKHMEHVMAKLDLHSRVQLARWAAQPGNLRLLS